MQMTKEEALLLCEAVESLDEGLFISLGFTTDEKEIVEIQAQIDKLAKLKEELETFFM